MYLLIGITFQGGVRFPSTTSWKMNRARSFEYVISSFLSSCAQLNMKPTKYLRNTAHMPFDKFYNSSFR